MAVNYFSDLFASAHHSDVTQAIWDIPEMITEEVNIRLTKDISLEEVWHALFSLNP